MLEVHARLLLDLPAPVKSPNYIEEEDADEREENYDGCSLYPNYSGRGMYGKTTWGIVIPSSTSITSLVADALERLHDEIVEQVIIVEQNEARVITEWKDTSDEDYAELDRLQKEFNDVVRECGKWKEDSMGRDSIIVY